jgi:hypothetical protein
MANTNAPFGLLPLGLNNSPATPSFGLIERIIDADNTNVITRGDPCLRLTTGYIDRITTGNDSTAVVSDYAGVFWGCEYMSVAQQRKVVSTFWPGADAASDVKALLVPLAGATPGLFMIQSSGTAIGFDDIGANAYMTYAAPTSQGVVRRSGVVLDQASLNTTPGFPLRIEGLWSSYAPAGSPGTDDTTDYNIAVVSFNNAQLTGVA